MKYPLLCIFIVNFWSAIAQNNPLFETRLYFEDQAGHKDTLSVGFDTSANEFFNPQFGEINLEQTFSDVLEVRAAHRSIIDLPGFDGVLSKRIITSGEKVDLILDPSRICHTGGNIILFIKTNHFPVKITWDSLDFVNSQECIYNSFMTPDFSAEVIDPIAAWILFPGKRFACIRKVDEFIVNLDPEYRRVWYPDERTYKIVRKFNSQDFDTLYGLSLFFTYEARHSPCILVSDNEHLEKDKEEGFIFPNPVHETLHLDRYRQIDFDHVLISNTEGRIIRSIPARDFEGTMPLVDFPDGVYQLILKKEGIPKFNTRFIKF